MWGFAEGGELSSVTVNIEKLKSISLFQDVDLLQCINHQVDFSIFFYWFKNMFAKKELSVYIEGEKIINVFV